MAKATQSAYGVNTGFTPIVQPVVQTRDPTNLDVNYPLFQQWWNKTAQTLWILNSFTSSSGTVLANWEISSSDAIATSYATDSGSAVPVANTLTISGTSAQGVSTSGSGSTVSITNADWTTSQKGVGTLATNAETIAGSVTTKAVTPDDLKAKLGVQTANGIPYGAGNSSAISWLSPGSVGQYLISNGGASSPSWQTNIAFCAYSTVDQNNVTGDNTSYTVIFDTAIINYGSAYNTSSGVFTAPYKGVYNFYANAQVEVPNGSGTDQMVANLKIGGSVSNGNWGVANLPTRNLCTGFYGFNGNVIVGGSATVLLNAGDTVAFAVAAGNGTKTTNITTDSVTFTDSGTYFCGNLLFIVP